MVHESVTKALNDANLKYNKINQAVVGYVYGNINDYILLLYIYNTIQ